MDDNSSLYLQAAWNRRNNSAQNDAQRIYNGRGIFSQEQNNHAGLSSYGIEKRQRQEEEKRRQIIEETKQSLQRDIREQVRNEMQTNELEHKKKMDEMENEKRLLMKLLQQKNEKIEVKQDSVVPPLTSVEKETGTINDELCCVVCMDIKRNMICKPCNHLALCENCSSSISKCPVCMAQVTKMKKIYIA